MNVDGFNPYSNQYFYSDMNPVTSSDSFGNEFESVIQYGTGTSAP
jgi:hypothetical protein